jgi:Concanavalin A-like lectin/glucanases superfamily
VALAGAVLALAAPPPISTAATRQPTASPRPQLDSAALSYDSSVLSDHPVAYYAQGARDATGHGHNGSFTGTVRSTSSLPDGELAPVYTGRQYLSIPSSKVFSIPATGRFTWEAWIQPSVVNYAASSGGYINYMQKTGSNADEWEARMYDQNSDRPSRLSAYAFNLSGGLGSGAYWQEANSSQIAPGRWLYVVGVYTMKTITIYVDGVKWDQAAHSPTGLMSQYNVMPKHAGAPVEIGTQFQGSVGKVAFYDYALSQAQVSAHWKAMTGLGSAGSCSATCTLDAAARALR